MLTIRGLNGGGICLRSRASKSILFKKNGCRFIASSPPAKGIQPRRLVGFFVINCIELEINKN